VLSWGCIVIMVHGRHLEGSVHVFVHVQQVL
jgi:hypothetical protein